MTGKVLRYALILACALLFAAPALAAVSDVEAWYEDGQVWIVWVDDSEPLAGWRVYRGTNQFTSTTQATMVGVIFPQETQAWRIKVWDEPFAEDINWTIPQDGVGTRTLADDENVIAFTPHSNGSEYFAVVRDTDTAVSSTNRTASLTAYTCDPTNDPVRPHVQYFDDSNGYDVTVYALWIDGSDDYDSPRADIPIMGNGWKNGTPHVFSVNSMDHGSLGSDIPATLLLHGGGGNWFGWLPDQWPTQINLEPENGITVAHDDVMYRRRYDADLDTVRVVARPTWWFGYWEDYDPCVNPAGPAPSDGVIVNYTQRRLDWINDWLIDEWDVDENRISIMGHSMGGAGAFINARFKPGRYASSVSFTPPMKGPVSTDGLEIMGEMDLVTNETNLTSYASNTVHVADVMFPEVRYSPFGKDYPVMRVYAGRDDINDAAGWVVTDVVGKFNDMNDNQLGVMMYWDSRGHNKTDWDCYWANATRGNTFDDVAYQEKYRANKSFPGFYDDDQDTATAGRQPDIGSGGTRDGDLYGTWSGYYDWDTTGLTDTADTWECEMWLVSNSANTVDNFTSEDFAKASVVVLKPQNFTPSSSTSFNWTLKRSDTSEMLQSGSGAVDANGEAHAPDLFIHTESDYKVKLNITTSGSSRYIFSDYFETPRAPSPWTQVDDEVYPLSPNAAYNGDYGARMRYDGGIKTEIDCSDYTTVTLSYARRAAYLDQGFDLFTVDWSSDGSTWSVLETSDTNGWQTKSYQLSGAGGDSSVWIRFRLSADGANEILDLDDVEVAGQ